MGLFPNIYMNEEMTLETNEFIVSLVYFFFTFGYLLCVRIMFLYDVD